VVAFGDVHDEGSKESYCLFHIEPIHEKERLRRIEHEVFSLLKAVFLGGRRTSRTWGASAGARSAAALAARRRRRAAVGARVPRSGCRTTTTSSWARCPTARPKDGTLARLDETATGVFTDPTLLPSCSRA
jgi:hypothetical protein